jgi:hypothetical protein
MEKEEEGEELGIKSSTTPWMEKEDGVRHLELSIIVPCMEKEEEGQGLEIRSSTTPWMGKEDYRE